MNMYSRPEMSVPSKLKFCHCAIYFKSGDGESFVTNVYNTQKEKLILNNEEMDELDNEYHHIIKEHDHDEDSGHGVIHVRNNMVFFTKYE